LNGFGLAWPRSTFLEEVGESLVAAPVLAEPTVVDMLVEHQVALQETVEHGMLAQELLVGTADTQILAATEAAAERRDSSPPSSELSTEDEPRAPGWNRRLVLDWMMWLPKKCTCNIQCC
jgi:hypothetical protein